MSNANEPVSSPNLVADTSIGRNPHVLWRQLAGFLFWVVLLSLPAGGVIGAIVCIVLGGFTFADAWLSGIYKVPGRRSFTNISPMSWGIGMALLFIVAYPTYLFSRNKLRTIKSTNAFFIGTVILGGLMSLYLVFSILSALSGGTSRVVT